MFKIKIILKKIKIKKAGVLLAILTIPLITLVAINLLYTGKVFRGVSVAGIYLGGKTLSEAQTELGKNTISPDLVKLSFNEAVFEITAKEIGFIYDINGSISSAYGITRTGNFFYDIGKRLTLLFKPINLGLQISFDEEKMEKETAIISEAVSIEPVLPSATLQGKNIIINKGKKGMVVDMASLRTTIGQYLAYRQTGTINIPIQELNPVITDEEASFLKSRAEKLVNKSITLTFEDNVYLYKGNTLLALLDPTKTYKQEAIETLTDSVSSDLNRQPQEPVFVFNDTKVDEFAPAKDGIEVKSELLAKMLTGNLNTLETSDEVSVEIEIPVTKTPPKVSTKDVNNLGIRELIGKGVSHFAGSIPNRIHNIQLATSKFKGVLIPPNSTFSFNDTLGDVSELTGFKQAYIIKEGKTVLGDGGGVCQVSTTFFRAILKAGLPIVERAAHAYRVGYYEQDSPPGLDATVYGPHPDLKFKNDTPGYILIQPTVDTKNTTITFNLYGTADGRIATTTKPILSDQIAPPDDLYIEDPTLPAGTVKQIEHKAWGAKVTFTYRVIKDGQIAINKVFTSVYQPWQAVYMKGPQ